ncbi:hypothetical protein AB0B45_37605 [Nonomuraea sp. NPDC049152]|uniref:hypothetical protein n=1 Tax=Nonomuraea sp. NPDC049152 TaxID=3154350 RepID=UPI0033F11333
MAGLLLAGSAVMLTGSPAMAATGQCSGNRIEHLAVKTQSGTVKGYLNLYYDSRTGYNCARLDSAGKYWGVSKTMAVTLHSCKNKTSDYFACKPIKVVQDEGRYAKYAGPVKLYGKGHCIAASAVIQPGNSEAVRVTPSFHC